MTQAIIQGFSTFRLYFVSLSQPPFPLTMSLSQSSIHPFSTALVLNRVAGGMLQPIPANFGRKGDYTLNWSPARHRAHVETNDHPHPHPHRCRAGTDPTVLAHKSGKWTATPSVTWLSQSQSNSFGEGAGTGTSMQKSATVTPLKVKEKRSCEKMKWRSPRDYLEQTRQKYFGNFCHTHPIRDCSDCTTHFKVRINNRPPLVADNKHVLTHLLCKNIHDIAAHNSFGAAPFMTDMHVNLDITHPADSHVLRRRVTSLDRRSSLLKAHFVPPWWFWQIYLTPHQHWAWIFFMGCRRKIK